MASANECRVSVIIPVRDGARYLAQAVESVRAQTQRDSEIIVIDDGSADETPDVARRLGALIRYRRQPPSGIGAARNAGVALSTRPVLAFLDADDLWLPDKLRLQVAALASDPTVDIVFGHVDEFLDGAVAERDGAGVRIPRRASPGILPSCMLVRRTVFKRVGPFSVDTDVAEFADWYARAKDIGLGMKVIPETIVRRRIHGDNQGLRHADRRSQYARVLKASLDRRRRQAASGG